jgi:hypothetical protein
MPSMSHRPTPDVYPKRHLRIPWPGASQTQNPRLPAPVASTQFWLSTGLGYDDCPKGPLPRFPLAGFPCGHYFVRRKGPCVYEAFLSAPSV